MLCCFRNPVRRNGAGATRLPIEALFWSRMFSMSRPLSLPDAESLVEWYVQSYLIGAGWNDKRRVIVIIIFSSDQVTEFDGGMSNVAYGGIFQRQQLANE